MTAMTFTRREALAALAAARAWADTPADSRQATGVKVGEITPTSAVIWTRRTAASRRLDEGIRRRGHGQQAFPVKAGEDVNRFEGACPGAPGFVRVTVDRRASEWIEVGPESDFSHQFRMDGLRPATSYRFSVETREARGKRADQVITGKFRTAPRPSEAAAIRFALSSCQMYCRMDRADGFQIYESIERLDPAFLVSCGDNVYYDSEDPVANGVHVARYHWQRMYSLPTLASCLRSVPGYWQKDDHDVYSDDSWPSKITPKMGPFRFEEGQRIFREQTPSPAASAPMYRRFRWGSELEVWLPEGRDYRSPNTDPDGPAKSLWGADQKRWLKETLGSSSATWKIVVNPNPIIGPDHGRKQDNHANPAFAFEGREIRQWLKEHGGGRVIVMNGDRHWQYHSVDPDSGVHEFGCGPASDAHAVPPSGGENPAYHRFLRIKGGFLTVAVNPADRSESLVIEHRDIHGAAVHRAVFPKQA